jgi:hypothetical protein
MDFYPVVNIYSNWTERVECGVLNLLETEGVALSVIEGTSNPNRQLLVQVANTVYISNRNQRQDSATEALIALLMDENIAMCGPVRVKAVTLLTTNMR